LLKEEEIKMNFKQEIGIESYSAGDGNFWQTVGMANPIAAPIIMGKKLFKKPSKPIPTKDKDNDVIIPTKTKQGISNSIKIAIVSGVLLALGLIIVLVIKKN
jgi:hypothetical protein